ncbi:hypothetical protein HMPREF9088_0286 [Enterococcus italicus DSM 15952]|uniref:Uncharacterized protein n=1 Tax=Enterococcus italicus (strain DSM 15952 / CCUG 50447 / LMG 22039 / TP 1.5) TaxID=888064 RepID=E6LD51_ENTI1|nr:hypothetical protein HMPREF9088_0286 [Enterococcus italicus DSM 15952]OJG58270.1 hypothetical protein RT43_GL000869 [Enterococcus italicus DSM 15952]
MQSSGLFTAAHPGVICQKTSTVHEKQFIYASVGGATAGY